MPPPSSASRNCARTWGNSPEPPPAGTPRALPCGARSLGSCLETAREGASAESSGARRIARLGRRRCRAGRCPALLAWVAGRGGDAEGDVGHFREALAELVRGVAGEVQLGQHARSGHTARRISLQAFVDLVAQVAGGWHGSRESLRGSAGSLHGFLVNSSLNPCGSDPTWEHARAGSARSYPSPEPAVCRIGSSGARSAQPPASLAHDGALWASA